MTAILVAPARKTAGRTAPVGVEVKVLGPALAVTIAGEPDPEDAARRAELARRVEVRRREQRSG